MVQSDGLLFNKKKNSNKLKLPRRGKTRQLAGLAWQDKADRTGQDRTGQDRTGQDTTEYMR